MERYCPIKKTNKKNVMKKFLKEIIKKKNFSTKSLYETPYGDFFVK
jgi:hypothetical protein